MPRRVRFTEEEARAAVAASRCYSEALRRLGLRAAGGNHATIKKYVRLWGISTAHFDPHASARANLARFSQARPLDEVLVEHSSYSRRVLKERLFAEGIKSRRCELCGQGELWRGRRMSLILDHINGVGDDNRLEGLQVVCPNCAATLDTHCGKQNRRERVCLHCQRPFWPERRRQVYCSQACAGRRRRGIGRPETRKVPPPPYAQLIREVHAMGWSAVGRRYGVSDNAVRKWVRQYERERAADDAPKPSAARPAN